MRIRFLFAVVASVALTGCPGDDGSSNTCEPSNAGATEVECDDGVDDDCDGNTDCDDSECAADPACAPASSCTAATGELLVTLTWAPGSNLELGASTPLGSVSPDFTGPGADPNCVHAGDDQGTDGMETMSCPMPPTVGSYEVHVDNEAAIDVTFTLSITVDGQDVVSLKHGIPPVMDGDAPTAGSSPIASSVDAGSFQEWVAQFCLE